MDNATIAAIATPFGCGGIGIIRISGPMAFSFGASVFRSRGSSGRSAPFQPKPATAYDSHKLYFGHCIEPKTGQTIDEILITFMRSPATYTREDVVEIHSHGGPYILQSILEIAIQSGIRPAEPGEFTKRAFLNGRIDLTQAEAVIDVITAKSKAALQLANAQIQGQLRSSIENLRNPLLEIQTQIEACIDFPDETGDQPILTESMHRRITDIISELSTLIDKYDQHHFYREGVSMIIVGAPNVGKSSLMNRLLQKDRAIVTDIPGTTRDLIADTFLVDGVPITITDTAGIQTTSDPIEQMGILRARQHVATADLVLFVIDATTSVSATEIQFLEQLHNKKILLVVNKMDLIPSGILPDVSFLPSNTPQTAISALTGYGMVDLKRTMMHALLQSHPDTETTIAPNLRQTIALKNCRDACSAILSAGQHPPALELVAIDLQDAIGNLDAILGIHVTNDVLDRIFKNFCIGK